MLPVRTKETVVVAATPKKEHEGPPLDKGYAWVAVVLCFLILFPLAGLTYSLGIYFTHFEDSFETNRGSTAWVSSIMVSVMLLTCWGFGRTMKRVGLRRTACTGSILIFVGLLGISFADELYQALIGSFVAGVGLGASYLPAVVVVQTWFDIKLGLATGISFAGSGVGNFVFPVILQLLIDKYDWRRAMRIQATILVTVILSCGLLLKQHPNAHKRMVPHLQRTMSQVGEEEEDEEEMRSNDSEPPRREAMAVICASKAFKFLMAGYFISGIGYSNPFVHMVPYAKDEGLSEDSAAYILSAFGLASFLGRVTLGMLSDLFGRLTMLKIAVLGMGLVAPTWTFCTTLPMMLAFAFVYGYGAGGFIALPPAVASHYFGSSHISELVGLLFAANSLPSAIGPVFSGVLFDLTDDYLSASLFTSLVLLAGVVLWFQMPKLAEEDEPESVELAQQDTSV